MKKEDYTVVRFVRNSGKPRFYDYFLIRCNRCGKEFVWSDKWIKSPRSECSCVSGKRIDTYRYGDFCIRELSKENFLEFKQKVDSKNEVTLSLAFDIIYVQNLKVNEFTALCNYVGVATLFRRRAQIAKLYFEWMREKRSHRRKEAWDRSNALKWV